MTEYQTLRRTMLVRLVIGCWLFGFGIGLLLGLALGYLSTN